MNKSIKLSPKYGLNAGMPVCFFCGEATGEIALFGKIGKGKEDIEAPKYFISNYEPCDKCRERIGESILVIGVSGHSNYNGQLAIQREPTYLYPTGVWCAMRVEAVQRIFNQTDDEMKVIRSYGKLLVDSTLLEEILENAK